MQRFTVFSGLILSCVSAGCLLAGAQEQVPGRLVLGIYESASPAGVSAALARHGLRARRKANSHVVVVAADDAAAHRLAESLRATGLFRYVEPDYYAHTGRTPDDGLFWSQWYLKVIQAESAWDTTTGSSRTTIGIVDSGVDAGHPDLAGRLVPGHNFLDDTENVSDTMGHGTAVAGVLGAASDNGEGVAGLTWRNPLMPLVVVDAANRAAYSDIAAAIRYAADHGVRVVNVSLGGTAQSAAMQEAVDYAWSKGTLIFAAAMNQSVTTAYYPAACDHVVAVSATDVMGGLASFSNYGRWVSLSAPGSMIMSTSRGGGYGYWSGTSFASPVAAGLAGLVLSLNPALGPAQVADILKQSADDLGAPGYDIFYGWGRVNAARALTAAKASLNARVVPATPPEKEAAPAPVAPAPADPAPDPGPAQPFEPSTSPTVP